MPYLLVFADKLLLQGNILGEGLPIRRWRSLSLSALIYWNHGLRDDPSLKSKSVIGGGGGGGAAFGIGCLPGGCPQLLDPRQTRALDVVVLAVVVEPGHPAEVGARLELPRGDVAHDLLPVALDLLRLLLPLDHHLALLVVVELVVAVVVNALEHEAVAGGEGDQHPVVGEGVSHEVLGVEVAVEDLHDRADHLPDLVVKEGLALQVEVDELEGEGVLRTRHLQRLPVHVHVVLSPQLDHEALGGALIRLHVPRVVVVLLRALKCLLEEAVQLLLLSLRQSEAVELVHEVGLAKEVLNVATQEVLLAIPHIVVPCQPLGDGDAVDHLLVGDLLGFGSLDLCLAVAQTIRAKVEVFVDAGEGEGGEVVAVFAVARRNFGVEAVGDLDDAEDLDLLVSLVMILVVLTVHLVYSLVYSLTQALKADVLASTHLASVFLGEVNLTGEGVLEGVDRLVGPGRPSPPNLLKVSEVELGDQIELEKRLLQLLLNGADPLILLGSTEI
uniref:Uncharacterized protein n=1 Tax=Strombidium rassoulzadegani TaxID=1082188 RepID=A0A7S3FXG6_9SPIT|mmetsp:Transcript_7019/g.11789  ORF Transcript_7019/g.11789 Transcript_7019/m.11789 type:complete len:500 (+) Transcript_7019:451-1950(+)